MFRCWFEDSNKWILIIWSFKLLNTWHHLVLNNLRIRILILLFSDQNRLIMFRCMGSFNTHDRILLFFFWCFSLTEELKLGFFYSASILSLKFDETFFPFLVDCSLLIRNQGLIDKVWSICLCFTKSNVVSNERFYKSRSLSLWELLKLGVDT